jgi:hypothetical protein
MPTRVADRIRTRRIPALISVFGALALAAGPLQAATAAAQGSAQSTGEHPTNSVLFVSPNGDDRNSGTSPFRPLRTLQHARDVVRTLNQNMTGDLTVELLSGTYRLTAPLDLTAADSGSNGHRVIWTAAPGADPVISGGEQITGWQLSDPTKGIWSAPAPTGLQTRQLYVNGLRAQRAAGPLPVTLKATSTGYTASSDLMAGWRNPSDIEFVYTGGDGYWSLSTGGSGSWTEPRCPVASILGTTITMAQPCWDNSNLRVLRTDGSGRTVNLVGPKSLGNGEIPASVENAYELLDQPGEWYLDSSANQIYYIPRPGEHLRSADVEVPVLQTLVSGQGSADAPIHHVTFSGIQFSYATWLQPSTPEGFSEIQATYTITGTGGYATQGLCQFVAGGTCPYGDWTKTPGNVSFSYDQNISLTDDTFTHLGAAGLNLGDGSQNDLVQGCVFTDISGNGLELGGVDLPEPTSSGQHTTGNTIQDNHLYALPVEFHGGVAIDVGYAEHTLIAHNQIDHTAYTAISLGWGGWPDKIAQPATPNYSNNNTLSDNLIVDPMQMLSDGGAIYTQGITGTSLADGEHITGNVIVGSMGHGHALYMDNGSTFISATGNVELGNENDWGARHTDYQPGATGSDPLDISDNWWQQGDQNTTSNNVTVLNNHIIANASQAPQSILWSAGLSPQFRGILYERTSPTSAPDAPTQVAAFGANATAYVAWNPPFVDHGSPVRSYTVTASPGGASATISATQFAAHGYAAVSGLTNGAGYNFTVTATNWSGTSAPSLPSATILPNPNTGTAPTVPPAVTANPGDGDASVHVTPASSTGGTPILDYVITGHGVPTTTLTGHPALWANSSRNIFTVVPGLTDGKPYLLQVSGRNATGIGAPGYTTVVPGTVPACSGATTSVNASSTLAAPGSSVTVTTTLKDGCTGALTGAKLYLFATNGYGVSPTGAQSVGDVAAGTTATQTWTVTVPADATSGAHLFAVAVFGDSGSGSLESKSSSTTIALPYASLAAAFNNVGVTDDTNTATGNLDGAGSSLSAQSLATAGVSPGTMISHAGLQFSWPSTAFGSPDNVVAGGQAVALTGTGGTLGLLVTATYGPATGAGQILYSDGTSQSFTITAPDWYAAPPATSDPAISMAYRNRPGNAQQAHSVTVYYVGVPLQVGKTVTTVVLPNVSSTVASGTAAMHIFAASIQ